jgi:hypothetical protein
MALGDVEVRSFLQWGMTSIVPSRLETRWVWAVRRRRAPVSAGEFSLVDVLCDVIALGSACASTPCALEREVWR